MFGPESIVGGAVINNAAAFRRTPERIKIAEVPGDDLYVETFEIIPAAGRSNETADLFAAFEENSNQMRSDESSAACDECFHNGLEL